MEEYANYDKKEEKKISGKKQRFSIPHILGGEVLKEDFVVKQSKLIIFIVFLFVLLISNRYSCIKKIAKIETLKRELKDVKYENLSISTELTVTSRQSQIETLLREKNIDLSGSKTPAYEIQK